jgi:hypothetical protein
MSYYILPKNNNIINVNPSYSNNECKPYLSFSFFNYYIQIKKQIINMFIKDNDLSDNTFEEAVKIINPYEFIFSKVPGSKFSVSKLKPNTNLFYDLYEIFKNFDLLNQYDNRSINSLHISEHCGDSVECYEMFREGHSDTILALDSSYNTSSYVTLLNESKYDYMFLETSHTNHRDYINSFVNIITIILQNQSYNGNVIIKINDILHKPILDCIYFLTSLYDKVYIAKPNTNNITFLDRYLVCKSFQYNTIHSDHLNSNLTKLTQFLEKIDNRNVKEILDINVPSYFKNKIDDLNIIIGQQQIEALDQIVNIFKNKNKNEKIENMKKSNIQKSVLWCEKYKIPCNKFTEKINIFLPIINETI